MKRIWAVSAALALVLSGCESEQPEPIWYGQIRNSCGPNDAPVVTIGIDTTAYADCADPFPEEFFRVDAGVTDLDSVAVGQVFDTMWSCPNKCAYIGVLRIKIERTSAEGLQAWIRMADSSFAGGVSRVREGRALLERCRERPICG